MSGLHELVSQQYETGRACCASVSSAADVEATPVFLIELYLSTDEETRLEGVQECVTFHALMTSGVVLIITRLYLCLICMRV